MMRARGQMKSPMGEAAGEMMKLPCFFETLISCLRQAGLRISSKKLVNSRRTNSSRIDANISNLKYSSLGILAFLCLVLCINATPSHAQAKKNPQPALTSPPPKSNTRDGATRTDTPTIQPPTKDQTRVETEDIELYIYEFSQPQFVVPRFIVKHNAQGQGSITFERRNITEAFTEPFTFSPAALARVVALWSKLNFLDSTENYQAEKDFSHLGTTLLTMQASERTRTATFNWTKNPEAVALVTEYRRVMDQALFVFDINLARTNQPLEAPGIMKRLEILVARNGISDAGQIAALLRDLTTDERIPLIARNKAEKLLKKIEKMKL